MVASILMAMPLAFAVILSGFALAPDRACRSLFQLAAEGSNRKWPRVRGEPAAPVPGERILRHGPSVRTMHQGGGTLPPLICFRQLDPRPAPEIPRLNLRSVVVLNPNFATSMAGPVFSTSQLAFAGMVSLVLFLFLAVVP